MNKDALVSVLANLETADLLKALALKGIGGSGDGEGGLAGFAADSQPDEKVQGWGERKVTLKGSGERPSLLDKEWLEKPQQKDPGLPIDWVMDGEPTGGLNEYSMPLGQM